MNPTRTNKRCSEQTGALCGGITLESNLHRSTMSLAAPNGLIVNVMSHKP